MPGWGEQELILEGVEGQNYGWYGMEVEYS